MSKNILIVEDETIIAIEIERYLSSLGYTILATCSTADDAYENAINHDVDLILMDIYLVDSNGIDAALRIKQEKNIPIIFVTANMDEATIEHAVSADPIAYLTKPFNRQELFAAIKIGMSKHGTVAQQRVGDMVLDHEFSFDTQSAQLICCSEKVHLNKKERQLLELFLQHKNILVSFMTMEYELWEDKPSSDSRRRTLISRLRAKLKHRFIETYSSEGYVFRV